MRNESETGLGFQREMSLKNRGNRVHHGSMKTIMKLEEPRILEDVRAFLEGTQAVVFEVAQTKAARYRWIERILIRFSYSK